MGPYGCRHDPLRLSLSSINLFPTFEYSQPDEYRFSHDSVFMARRIFEMYRQQDIRHWDCLDLCCGCGIIGLDFLFHLQTEALAGPKTFDFMDVQEIYQSHFLKNVKQLGDFTTQIEFITQNYQNLLAPELPQKYDLILANPPYFDPHQGALSPNAFKNRCRFFLDSTFKVFLEVICSRLKASGAAYFLSRDALKNLDLPEDAIKRGFTLEKLPPIRNTHFYKITQAEFLKK